MKNKLFALLSLLILASMVLAACGGGANEAPMEEPAAPAEEPAAPAEEPAAPAEEPMAEFEGKSLMAE